MKKLLIIITICALMLGATSCATLNFKDNDKIKTAISCLEETWAENNDKMNGTISEARIIHTRIMWISENDNEHLSNIECIVEFEIYSDYYGCNNGYVQNVGVDDVVVFYTDGTYETESRSPFDTIIAYTFSLSATDLIEKTNDYGTRFNQELDLK